MVSKQLFNRMSIIALVAIVLFGAVAFRADAKTYIEHISEESAENDTNYDAPTILFLDSGFDSGFGGALTKDDVTAIRSDLAAIRQNSDIFIYFVIPFSVAVLIIIKGCIWFSRTFIRI